MDVAIAAGLAAIVFVVHPLSYVFHHPLWLDEAWVATLAKAPWPRAYALSSSTPVGWLFLVRLVPGGRGEQLRIVPLLFAAGEVAAAYVLARALPWGSEAYARAAGAATALVVLLAPVSLVRNDLKQYTADAFFALVILALASRAEGRPGTRTMTEFVVVSVFAALFSTVAAFVTIAATAGLFGAALLARSRDRIRTVALGGAAAVVALGAYFALVVLPHTSASLRSYWDDFYLPSSPLHALGDSWTRFDRLAPALGVSAVVAVALFAAGCFVCARFERPGLGLAFALLWLEMMVVAMARRYPFLDLRTSHFLLVVSLVAMTLGFVGVVRMLTLMPGRRWLVIVVCFLGATLFLHNSVGYIRARWIPNEDVRSAVAYVADHSRPGDVIVVSLPSSFGFSYYWPGAHIAYVEDDAVSMGFVTRVPGLRDVVYVHGLTPKDTTGAVRRALGSARSGRIWIIRTHLFESEAESWQQTFRTLGLHPREKQVGTEPIWIVG